MRKLIVPSFIYNTLRLIKYDKSSLTSRGDLRKKLEYAFALYDADGSGSLDSAEVRAVLSGMLDLLGADKRANNVAQLTDECIKELDATRDGKITKGKHLLSEHT